MAMTIEEMRQRKWILDLKGKAFITYKGLVMLADEQGWSGTKTELVFADREANRFEFKATVTGEAGTYEGHGDADPSNVGRMIIPHMLRMAETRAIARALRQYTRCELTAAEEMGGNDEPQGGRRQQRAAAKAPAQGESPKDIADARRALNTILEDYKVPAGKFDQWLRSKNRPTTDKQTAEGLRQMAHWLNTKGDVAIDVVMGRLPK